VVDLTFDSVSRRILKSNVKSKTTLESNLTGVALVLTFVNELAATGCECQNRDTSVVDLTFDSVSRRILKSNVKSKATLESNLAGVALVLTFVNELAATGYECQNRDTSMNFGRV
jgi:hypothetical protein